MFERLRYHWLPWALCRFCLLLSGILVLLVLASPIFDDGRPAPRRGHRLVAVFARDLALRRTAVAGAVGLAVTAWIFFRPEEKSGIVALEPSELSLPGDSDPH
jgi:hypothetical protein